MHRRRLLSGVAAAAGAAFVANPAEAQRVIAIGEQRAAPNPPRAPAPGPEGTSQSDGLAEPAQGRYRKPAHDFPIKNGHTVRGTRDISAAWLSSPVQRYRHYVLGLDAEPETLTTSLTDRRLFRLTLPTEAVFEDRIPRLVDIDGDGRDEVVVVKSHQRTGSVVAVAKIKSQAEGLTIIAESAAPGEPFRWINPAGIAAFTGQGRLEIAAVRQPHAVGELELLVMTGGRLEVVLVVGDVSNHAIGSFHQTLHVVADFNGDGVPDLAIPSFDRRELRFLSFKGGKVTEFHRVMLPTRAQEDFRLVMVDNKPAVDVGFASGRRHVVTL